LIIGVAGKIASGKSTVCSFLKNLIKDCIILDVDSIAKKIYSENPAVVKKLEDSFGASIFFSNGNIDYNKLALKIFSSRENLKKINSIMFPEIENKISKILKEEKHRSCVIVDAAVLFDAGLYKYCDYIIWVDAERERRFEQLTSCSSLSKFEIKKRIDGQMVNIIEELVDFKIKNNGILKDLKEDVKKIVSVINKT
jgi:dephospho-CoA kinase